jgi:PIN like domain
VRPDSFLPPEPRPRALEDVRFYVDEDILGLGYAMAWSRRDVIVCGSAPIAHQLARGTLDPQWIPVVAARGWIAITGNGRIRTHPDESRLAVENGLRVICVSDSRGPSDTWQKLTYFARHWTAVENHIAAYPDGPWWLNVQPSGTALRSFRTT